MNLTDINDFRPEEVNEAILFAINNGWVRPPRWEPKPGDLVLDRFGTAWAAIVGDDGELCLARVVFSISYDQALKEYGPLEPHRTTVLDIS